jgi:hypothetical protein
MATLPEGRKPLTDGDMVILLHDIARAFSRDNNEMATDIRETADRLSELANKAATRRHWTGHE